MCAPYTAVFAPFSVVVSLVSHHSSLLDTAFSSISMDAVLSKSFKHVRFQEYFCPTIRRAHAK
jgi:hypothetical protein